MAERVHDRLHIESLDCMLAERVGDFGAFFSTPRLRRLGPFEKVAAAGLPQVLLIRVVVPRTGRPN
jgi:hypothetical protein